MAKNVSNRNNEQVRGAPRIERGLPLWKTNVELDSYLESQFHKIQNLGCIRSKNFADVESVRLFEKTLGEVYNSCADPKTRIVREFFHQLCQAGPGRLVNYLEAVDDNGHNKLHWVLLGNANEILVALKCNGIFEICPPTAERRQYCLRQIAARKAQVAEAPKFQELAASIKQQAVNAGLPMVEVDKIIGELAQRAQARAEEAATAKRAQIEREAILTNGLNSFLQSRRELFPEVDVDQYVLVKKSALNLAPAAPAAPVAQAREPKIEDFPVLVKDVAGPSRAGAEKFKLSASLAKKIKLPKAPAAQKKLSPSGAKIEAAADLTMKERLALKAPVVEATPLTKKFQPGKSKLSPAPVIADPPMCWADYSPKDPKKIREHLPRGWNGAKAVPAEYFDEEDNF